MLKIEAEAEKYISELFADQDSKDLGLKIEVENAETPMANVSFNFCYSNDLSKGFIEFKANGFKYYIHEDDIKHMDGAKVDLKKDGYAHKLTIYAPNSKGEAPNGDSPLEEKIKYFILAEVNPQLSSHGGFVELMEITKEIDVVLNFGGGCQGCSSVKVTLKNGVEKQLKGMFSEIRNVLDVTDHTNTENSYM